MTTIPARSGRPILLLLLTLGACSPEAELLDGPSITGVVATTSGVAWARQEPGGTTTLLRWNRTTRRTTTIAEGFDSMLPVAGVGHGDTVYWGFTGPQLEVVMSRPDLESVKTVDLQGIRAESLLDAGPDYVVVKAAHDSYWRIPLGEGEPTCLVPTIVKGAVSSAAAWNDDVFLFFSTQILRVGDGASKGDLELSLQSAHLESRLTTRAEGGWLLWSLPTPSCIAAHQLGTTRLTTWTELDTEEGMGCHACPKISAFTADRTHAYWIRALRPCECPDDRPDLSHYWVRRISLWEGAVETVAGGQGLPPQFLLEVDDANVYWVDDDGLHFAPK